MLDPSLSPADKLFVVRRIHANFHFLISSEPKMGVELFDDYSTVLQLAKDCMAGGSLAAYQGKTGFFRSFLCNSYEPDPGKQAS